MAKYARNAKSVKARYVTQSTRAVPIILGRDFSRSVQSTQRVPTSYRRRTDSRA